MTGGTGPGSVGGNIVQSALNFSPVGHCMTVAAELARCTKGEISGTDLNGVPMSTVDRVKTGGMTGGAVARGRLPCGNAELGTGIGVVTAVTAIMRGGGNADQGVVVTTGTVAGSDRYNPAVIRCDRMKDRPGGGMTGGTVTTGGEVLTDRRADQSPVDIVTAGAAVMGSGCGTRQGVVVTTGTARRCLNQGAVVRVIGCMGSFPATAMTGGTVSRRRLTRGDADPGAGCGVVTATTSVMGGRCGTDQGVIVAIGAAGGAGHGDDTAVDRGTCVQGIPVAGMTTGAIANSEEVLTDRQASQAAVDIVTADTTVMGLGCSAEQGVVVTASTVSRCNLNQGAVVREIGCMGRFPSAGMTAGAIAAADRDPRQESRNGAVTEVTITHMRAGHCGIGRHTGIVTGQTGGRSTDITERHMINIQVHGQVFVGVTRQTVGRIST